MRFLIGAADANAALGDLVTLQTNAQSASNAHVTISADAVRDQQYGTAAVFQSVEDKAVLVFQDGQGALSRFQLPAPKAAVFLADGETVDVVGAASAFIISMETFCYGRDTDTSPLAFVGGYRLRRKIIRRTNIWTTNPAETGPDE